MEREGIYIIYMNKFKENNKTTKLKTFNTIMKSSKLTQPLDV